MAYYITTINILIQKENTIIFFLSCKVFLEKPLIINPTRVKISKTNLTDFNGNSIPIKQSSDGSTINPAGFPEETESEDVFLLDDGTSLCGITVCQTCKGVIKEENLRRCKCGKTCCIIKGCGKYSKYRDEWYCSGLHKFLGELGINLR